MSCLLVRKLVTKLQFMIRNQNTVFLGDQAAVKLIKSPSQYSINPKKLISRLYTIPSRNGYIFQFHETFQRRIESCFYYPDTSFWFDNWIELALCF